MYYYNVRTKRTQWEHPMDEYHRQLYIKEKGLKNPSGGAAAPSAAAASAGETASVVARPEAAPHSQQLGSDGLGEVKKKKKKKATVQGDAPAASPRLQHLSQGATAQRSPRVEAAAMPSIGADLSSSMRCLVC